MKENARLSELNTNIGSGSQTIVEINIGYIHNGDTYVCQQKY